MKEGVQFKRGTGSLSVQLQCQSEAVSAPENFRTKEISREKRIFFIRGVLNKVCKIFLQINVTLRANLMSLINL